MCIIVYKRKGLCMPPLALLENCFTNNPNGAGFMYRQDGLIHISKGYMDFDSFLNALLLVEQTVNMKKTDVVFHFRISTTGSSIPQNCHPFPLSNRVKDLKALNIKTMRAIAHNGILTEYAGYHNTASDMSDTMYFCKMLSGVKDRFVESVITNHSISTNSRFVYMSGKGKTIGFGMHKIQTGDGKGLWVSNDTYKEYVPVPPYAYNYQYYRPKAGGNITGTYPSDDTEYNWDGDEINPLVKDKEKDWQEWMEKNRAHNAQVALRPAATPTKPAPVKPVATKPVVVVQSPPPTEFEQSIRDDWAEIRALLETDTTPSLESKLIDQGYHWVKKTKDNTSEPDNTAYARTKAHASVDASDLTVDEKIAVHSLIDDSLSEDKTEKERKDFIKFLNEGDDLTYFRNRYGTEDGD